MDTITFENSSTQNYLDTLQSIIARMETNSTSCKKWCITIISAIAILSAQGDNDDYIAIAYLPMLLFLFLDAYYLGLRRGFIRDYNAFVAKIKKQQATTDDLYIIATPSGIYALARGIIKAICSLTIWPFYGLLFVMLHIAKGIIGTTGFV